MTRALITNSRTTWLAFASIGAWLTAAAISGPLGIWPAIGGVAIALGVAVLLLDHSTSAMLLQPTLRLVFLGVIVSGLMVVATYLLYPRIARIFPFIGADTAQLYAAFRAPSLVVASVALVPVIVGEELVWRGVVQNSLVDHLGASRGIVLAALAYALAHAPIGSPSLVAAAFFCGLAWGVLRSATASLVPTLVAHLLWDVLVLLWLPLDTV